MKRNTPSVNTLGMLGVAALALGAGFGIARLSQSSSAPAPADAAPTAAEDNGGVQVVAIPDAYLGAAGIAVEAVTSADVAANIGAAARAMKTMGLSRLVLVQPKMFPHSDATALAAGAADRALCGRGLPHPCQSPGRHAARRPGGRDPAARG